MSPFRRVGIPDGRFVDHGSVTDLRRVLGLDEAGILAPGDRGHRAIGISRRTVRPMVSVAQPCDGGSRGRRASRRGRPEADASREGPPRPAPRRARPGGHAHPGPGTAPGRAPCASATATRHVATGGPATSSTVDVEIALERVPRYVSRGGEKLAGALDAFGVDPAGSLCLDVGASTGGFTDCLLQRGAQPCLCSRRGARTAGRVAPGGRPRGEHGTHPRRAAGPGRRGPARAAGARRTSPSRTSRSSRSPGCSRGIAAQTMPGADIVALVKPQFELSPRDVPRGVVRDPAVAARRRRTRPASHAASASGSSCWRRSSRRSSGRRATTSSSCTCGCRSAVATGRRPGATAGRGRRPA